MVDRFSHFRDKFRRNSRLQWRGLKAFVEPRAVDQLHAEVTLIPVKSYLVNRDNRRVVKKRDGFRLVLEPPNLILACQLAVPDYLQGDVPVQTNLPGLVNDSHAALPEHRQQFVVADIADTDTGRQRFAGLPAIRSAVRLVSVRGYLSCTFDRWGGSRPCNQLCQ